MIINLPATLTLDSDNLGVVEFNLDRFQLILRFSRRKKRYKERRKRHLPPICSPLLLLPIVMYSLKRERVRRGRLQRSILEPILLERRTTREEEERERQRTTSIGEEELFPSIYRSTRRRRTWPEGSYTTLNRRSEKERRDKRKNGGQAVPEHLPRTRTRGSHGFSLARATIGSSFRVVNRDIRAYK